MKDYAPNWMLLTLARNCSYQVPLICMRLFWLCFILFHLILFTSSQHVIVLLNSHILRLNSIHPRKHIRSWFSHRFIVTGQGRCTSFKSISKISTEISQSNVTMLSILFRTTITFGWRKKWYHWKTFLNMLLATRLRNPSCFCFPYWGIEVDLKELSISIRTLP